MSSKKRRYIRLVPSAWAEICALWEIGDVTLPDLADRYSVNTRTLQAHFAKHKIEKGSKSAALAASVKAEVLALGLGDKDRTVQRATETREAAYNQACIVEALLMGTLEAMQQDPTKTLGLSSKIKALALAASTMERTHGLKLRALGLDNDQPIYDELPILTFRDLSHAEITALQERDNEDDYGPVIEQAPELVPAWVDSEQAPEEIDEIVVEGDDAASEDIKEIRDGDGCRYVRGARP